MRAKQLLPLTLAGGLVMMVLAGVASAAPEKTGNLIKNGSFEGDDEGDDEGDEKYWNLFERPGGETIEIDSEHSSSGKKSLKIVNTILEGEDFVCVGQGIEVTPGYSYTVQAFLSTTNAFKAHFKINFYDTAGKQIDDTPALVVMLNGTLRWKLYSKEFLAPPTSAKAIVWCLGGRGFDGKNPGVSRFDEVRVTEIGVSSYDLPPVEIGIENPYFRLTFNKFNGQLLEITNKVTGTSYLKNTSAGSSPFLIFPDPTQDRPAHPSHSTFTSMRSLDSRDFRATSCQLTEEKGRKTLTFALRNKGDTLALRMRITVPDDKNWSVWTLAISNLGRKAVKVSAAFPLFKHLVIGKAADNLVTLPEGRGEIRQFTDPFDTSYQGIYGGECSMQWIAQFNPRLKEGFGVIVEDEAMNPKMIEPLFRPYFFISYPAHTLPPGKSLLLPKTVVMVHEGNWKIVADRYRQWFMAAFGPVPAAPKWFREGKWISPGMVLENLPTNMRDLGDLNLQFEYRRRDANYFIELNPHPPAKLGRAVYNDGEYLPREDLGGAGALRKAVTRIHAKGGRAIIYVDSMLCWAYTDLASKHAKDWSLMNAGGHYMRWYDDRWHFCPAVAGWQDHLAQVCARIIRDYDADGIRLDSIGAPVRWCYNPVHNHPYPHIWNQGVRELIGKVRKAITAVKPDAVLMAEEFIDFQAPYCTGALAYEYVEMKREFPESPAAYIFPKMAFFYYGPWKMNAMDSLNMMGINGDTLNGWSPKNQAQRMLNRHWSWTRKLFRQALVYGELQEEKMEASDSEIFLRLFKTPRYYLVTGAKMGAKLEEKPLTLNIGQIPGIKDFGLVLDVANFKLKRVELKSVASGYTVEIDVPTFTLLLPRSDCPPLLEMGDIPEGLLPGDSFELELSLRNEWSDLKKTRVEIYAPSLIINNRTLDQKPMAISIPTKIKVTLPRDSRGGSCILAIEGNSVLGYEKVVRVNPYWRGFCTVVPDKYGLVLRARIKNNQRISRKLTLTLAKPANWKMDPVSVDFAPGEEKVIRLTPRMAAIARGDPLFQIDLDDGSVQDSLTHIFTRRFSGTENPSMFFETGMGEISTSIEWDLLGKEKVCLRNWMVCAPFPNSPEGPRILFGSEAPRDWPGNGFTIDHLAEQGGETDIEPHIGMRHSSKVAPGGTVSWQKYKAPEFSLEDVYAHKITYDEYMRSLKVDLSSLGSESASTAYVACYISSPRKMDVQLQLKTNGGAKVWLNHRHVFWQAKPFDRAAVFLQPIPITLNRGKNLLLIKLANFDIGEAYWKSLFPVYNGGGILLSVLLTAPDGEPLAIPLKIALSKE